MTAGLALAAPLTPAFAADVACGDVISADVVLQSDLACTGDGLLIRGPATIDLNGHALTGGDSGGVGITVEGASSVWVKNGTLAGWGVAVAGNDDYDNGHSAVSVTRVSFIDNGIGLASSFGSTDIMRSHFEGNGRGVNAWPRRIRIESSTFVDNGVGAYGGDASALDIIRSTFEDNTSGIECWQTLCNVSFSTFRGNGRGLFAWLSVGDATRNQFSENDRAVYLTFSSRERIERNVFQRNTVGVEAWFADESTISDNQFRQNGTGFLVSAESSGSNITTLLGNSFNGNGDGILAEMPGLSLGDNSATNNDRWGIYAPGAVDLGGNTARRNGSDPQCVGVVC